MEFKYHIAIHIFFDYQIIDITEDDFQRLITEYSDYYDHTEQIDNLLVYVYKNEESRFSLSKERT